MTRPFSVRPMLGSSVLAVLLAALPAGVLTASRADASPSGYLCNGGTIPAGTYQRMTVAGACSAAAGTLVVRAGLTVASSAALSVPPGSALVVSGGVALESAGSLIASAARVSGGLSADHPTFLLLGATTVNGPVAIVGGISVDVRASTLNGGFSQRSMGSVGSTTIAQSTVRGGVVVANGAIRGGVDLLGDRILGGVSIVDVLSRSDMASTISGNAIFGGLVCVGNTPPPVNGGIPNAVAGREIGQCAGL